MGGRSMEVVYSGTLEGEELEGNVSMGRFSQTFTGAKAAGAVVAAAEPAQEEAAPAARERPEPAEAAADVAPAETTEGIAPTSSTAAPNSSAT